MTFSLVARCRETGMFGVAVASSSPAVAARCAYARAGVGAVASQNVTDPSLGPLTLDLMQAAMNAEAAIAEIKRRGKFIDYRQLLAVDQRGQTAIHSGRNSLGVWAEARAEDVASGGNLLANDRFMVLGRGQSITSTRLTIHARRRTEIHHRSGASFTGFRLAPLCRVLTCGIWSGFPRRSRSLHAVPRRALGLRQDKPLLGAWRKINDGQPARRRGSERFRSTPRTLRRFRAC
jgi:hypothetical protein